MSNLTQQQKNVIAHESHRVGLNLAQTMGGYGALSGLAIGAMYSHSKMVSVKKGQKGVVMASGALLGLIIGSVGGYFTGARQAKSLYQEYPDQIPITGGLQIK